MILSVASQKGGTGKSTTSITLASGLGRLNKKTLLIDVDPQANSSKVLIPHYHKIAKEKENTLYQTILERKPLPIHPTQIPNLEIVPSHILLSNTDIELTTALDHREARLKTELDKIKHHYEHIIIDCPPSLSWLTLNAFTASDTILVVIAPGYFELDSVAQISKTIQETRENFNPHLQLTGYLFNMSDTTVNSRTSLKLLRQTYTDNVLQTVIPKNTDLRDAHFMKQDVFLSNPRAKGAQAYKKLIKELFGYGEEIK